MNVIDWFVGGFLTEFSNEFMNVGCLMYVQRVGVNVWIYLCVRVDDRHRNGLIKGFHSFAIL